MPEGDIPPPEETSEIKWFGEEELFSIGDRPVKIWELLVGLIILSMLLPLFFRGGSRGGGSDGATVVNVRQTGTRKVYQRRKKKRK